MPLDGISTRCLSAELDIALRDARVDRIYQPDRHDILFILRQGHENLRLIVSANPSMPRMHLTSEQRENPSLPPMFCMLLRKHLLGARVLSVRTPGSERILEICFQTQNEIGDKVEKTLVAELMGRHSNIILLNEDRRIHDAIVHVDESISRVREVMPARVYVRPPDQNKRSIEDAARLLEPLLTPANALSGDTSNHLPGAAPAEAPDEASGEALGYASDEAGSPRVADFLAFFPPALQGRGIEKALLELIGGLSPALCHEIAFQAGLDGRQPVNQLTQSDLRLLLLALHQMISAVLAGRFRPTVFFCQESDIVPVDFHALALSDFAIRRPMPSLSAAMGLFYLERQRQHALTQSRQSVAKQISQQLDQARRRFLIHEADLQESQNKDTYRRNGDLILSLMHEIQDGQRELKLTAENSPDGRPAIVALDPAQNLAQNAQRYYKLYAKARSRASMSARLLEADRSEVDWLESLENAVASAENLADIKAVRDEISAVGIRLHSPFGNEDNGGNGLSGSGNEAGKSGSGHGEGGKHNKAAGTGAGTTGAKGNEPGKPGSRKRAYVQAKQKQGESRKGGSGKDSSGKGGAGKGGSGKGAKTPAALPPRRYTSSDGFTILVGRNNLQNDQLTLKQGRKDDMWLHVQRMPGTHVIISSGGRPVPERTLLEAAETAAYFSRASIGGSVAETGSGSGGSGGGGGSSQAGLSKAANGSGIAAGGLAAGAKVAVDYCPVAHVRKPAGARPGKVIYDRYQTLIVQPKDPARLIQNQVPVDLDADAE